MRNPLRPKDTASVMGIFEKARSDLAEIEERETITAGNLKARLAACEAEKDKARRFHKSLDNLLGS